MANPTTNYSFVLPTSSDLVTDLPADFDVALQGVDTRLKALQPGTTAGDLAYASSTANTNVRLGIGTAGQVLKVVSGVPAWGTDIGGKLLQVVEGTTATAVTTTSTSAADTGLTATITPTLNTSKILVIIAQWFEKTAGNVGNAVNVTVVRGATTLNAGGTGAYFYSNSSVQFRSCVPLLVLDSPATTSATTYKTQFASNVSGQTSVAQIDSYRSSIVLLEIGA